MHTRKGLSRLMAQEQIGLSRDSEPPTPRTMDRIAALTAEVERLKATYNTMVKGYEAQLATARADALKEVREILKAKAVVLHNQYEHTGATVVYLSDVLDATRGET